MNFQMNIVYRRKIKNRKKKLKITFPEKSNPNGLIAITDWHHQAHLKLPLWRSCISHPDLRLVFLTVLKTKNCLERVMRSSWEKLPVWKSCPSHSCNTLTHSYLSYQTSNLGIFSTMILSEMVRFLKYDQPSEKVSTSPLSTTGLKVS